MMKVDDQNTKKYTKRILNIILKKLILNWLGDYSDYFSFKPSDAVYHCSEHKMIFIKNYIKNLIYEDNNYQTVYIEIKDFVYFEQLLNYLSPSSFYTPEDTLIYLLRHYNKINIRFNPEYDNYSFSYLEEELLNSYDGKHSSNPRIARK